jgi:uncharacterized protein YgiB involved in biofilm formation
MLNEQPFKEAVMRGKMGFFIGFGAGYVLGTKAGRERYDQLRRLYDNILSSSSFEQARGRAKGAVGSGLSQAKEKASEGVAKVTEAVKSRSDDDRGLSVAPPPT